MTYKTVSDNEGIHVMLDGVEIAIKFDRVSALDFVSGHAIQRAEAAEVAAAESAAFARGLQNELKDAEAERAEARRQLSEAQTAIDAMAQIVGAADEVKHQLEQARSDIEDYRAEIARLTHKVMTTPLDWREMTASERDGAYRP